MEIKFTPWRMNYIKGGNAMEKPGCVLCNLAAGTAAEDVANLLLYRGQSCYVVMNLYPYNTAHLMVVPYEHTADLAGMADTAAQELFALTRRCVRIINGEYQPHGYNLGMNLGRTAGAGIDEHLHMHIVPRWHGDANFMPIVGGTKLLPEELSRSYERLRPHFDLLVRDV